MCGDSNSFFLFKKVGAYSSFAVSFFFFGELVMMVMELREPLRPSAGVHAWQPRRLTIGN